MTDSPDPTPGPAQERPHAAPLEAGSGVPAETGSSPPPGVPPAVPPAPPGRAPGGRVSLGLVLVLLAAAALRIGLALALPEQRLFGDEVKYVIGAFEFDHEEANTNTWPPGQSLLLLGILKAGPFDELRDGVREQRPQLGPRDSPFVQQVVGNLADGQGYRFYTWARVVQGLMGTLIVLLVYFLARVGLEHRAALVAASIYAFYPTAISYCLYLRSETLFTFLTMAALVLLARAHGRPGLGRFVMAGACWGLAVLTRSSGLVLSLPLVLPVLALTDRPVIKRVAAMALFVLATLVTVSPWSVRNYLEYDRFLLVDFSINPVLRNAHNAYLPPNPDYGMREEKREFDTDPPLPVRPLRESGDRVLRSRLELQDAIAFNLDNPGLALRRMVLKLREFWAPTSFLVLDMHKGKYGQDVSEGVRLAVVLTAVIAFVALTCAAVVGLFRLRDPRLLLIILVLILGTWGFHGLTQACSRYRMPLVPLMAIAAAAAVVPGEARRAMGNRAWIAASALISALLISMIMIVMQRSPMGF